MDGGPFYKANTIFFWPEPVFFRLPPTYFSYASAAGVRHIAKIQLKETGCLFPKVLTVTAFIPNTWISIVVNGNPDQALI